MQVVVVKRQYSESKNWLGKIQGMKRVVLGNRFPLWIKGKVYSCCVRSAILDGSETWFLKVNKKQY